MNTETTSMGIQDKMDLGLPIHRFNVMWQKTSNNEVMESVVDAINMADASWRVANETFDTVDTDERILIDIIQLS